MFFFILCHNDWLGAKSPNFTRLSGPIACYPRHGALLLPAHTHSDKGKCQMCNLGLHTQSPQPCSSAASKSTRKSCFTTTALTNLHDTDTTSSYFLLLSLKFTYTDEFYYQFKAVISPELSSQTRS